ncbi:hypothetical protein LPB142_17620 (plasmid) [Rhodobacter xanthinilyticus]|uniref:diguanylate cyclase n=1 Tax=Rhodobacter xanthinilyticus TaxID=1850250 RepID=A0A1D9MHE9_9RHOB|nr:diguanylate cyclase [Rhodobacter xanthinilyticus]AOZ71277.1 hypothetical protein LPB142_17620 [Rhodobacter xanthinilyticus]
METILHLIDAMAMMASIALVFGVIGRRQWSERVRHISLGAAFGLGAVFSMLQPVFVYQDAIIDARSLFIGFAGAFLGAEGAAVALGVAILGRLSINHQFAALIGVVGLIMAAGLGLVWARLTAARPGLPGRHLLLGVMISGALTAFLLLPGFGEPHDYALKLSAMMTFNIIGSVVLGAFIDRERQMAAAEAEARLAAATDPLTGLLNRRGLARRFQASEGARGSKGSALLLVDLDHFKAVNDTWGHGAGDAVLRLAGERLQHAARGQDTVSRVGGEEFAVLLTNVDTAEVRATAERLRADLAAPCRLSDTCAICITASVGAVCWQPGTQRLEIVSEAADRALYRAKSRGRDRAVIEAAL